MLRSLATLLTGKTAVWMLAATLFSSTLLGTAPAAAKESAQPDMRLVLLKLHHRSGIAKIAGLSDRQQPLVPLAEFSAKAEQPATPPKPAAAERQNEEVVIASPTAKPAEASAEKLKEKSQPRVLTAGRIGGTGLLSLLCAALVFGVTGFRKSAAPAAA